MYLLKFLIKTSMRKLYLIVFVVIFGLISVSPALAQDGGTMALEITSPKEGELITGDEILLNIKYSGESGNHAHIWLDEPNPTADNVKTLEAPGPFLFRDVKPGDHIVIVELAGEDHKPVDPAQKITLKVKTRSAADVTQEEIAKALSQVKPAVTKNSNNNPGVVAASQNQTDKSSVKSNFTIWIISGVIIIIIAIGAVLLLLRSKKQQ